jgi:(E)-4-hydroxy-3-methylbut-2-enyl-diphosphate synthase
VYAAGKTDHTIQGISMVDHIVELVERKVEAIQHDKAAAETAQAA